MQLVVQPSSSQYILNVTYLSKTVPVVVDASSLMAAVFDEATKILSLSLEVTKTLALFSCHERPSWLSNERPIKYFNLPPNV